jgi:hypothetical protein
MAATAISTGALLLLAARSGERAPEGLRSALRVAAVVATAALGVAAVSFPGPPVVGLAVADVAALVGVALRERAVPATPSLDTT